MSLDSEIVVVSGLPRSGTSLMMQMLDRAGIPPLTDQVRAADLDNPRGYYEFEPVKKTRRDASWLPAARGKAVKIVSPLLYDLPATERYRVLFLERDLGEVIASQTKMLQRRHQPAAPADPMRSAFELHLQRLFEWLPRQSHMRVLRVNYNRLVADPLPVLELISEFLDGRPNVESMAGAIDPKLYRNQMPESSGIDGSRPAP
jgi:hypothetical protein